MDTQTHVEAFNALIDRGVDPSGIDNASIQHEAGRLALKENDARSDDDIDLDTWRTATLNELFCHVEFMVERLRYLVEAGDFDASSEETKETTYRLNLSSKSIQHLSNRDDSELLMGMQRKKSDCPS